jgi:hypothetical protein
MNVSSSLFGKRSLPYLLCLKHHCQIVVQQGEMYITYASPHATDWIHFVTKDPMNCIFDGCGRWRLVGCFK